MASYRRTCAENRWLDEARLPDAVREAIAAGVCGFASVKGACDATILAIQSGIPVARSSRR